MSAEARANGWRGFDGIGTPTEGGHLYRCDGMPSQFGCGQELVLTRRLARVGKKARSGWLVCYGLDDDDTADKDVVLTFCPKCAAHVTGGSTPETIKTMTTNAPTNESTARTSEHPPL